MRGPYKLIKSFGSSKSEEDLAAMEKDTVDFISTYGGQTVLDFEQCRKEEERVHAEKLFESIVDIRQDGVRLILEPNTHYTENKGKNKRENIIKRLNISLL